MRTEHDFTTKHPELGSMLIEYSVEDEQIFGITAYYDDDGEEIILSSYEKDVYVTQAQEDYAAWKEEGKAWGAQGEQ